MIPARGGSKSIPRKNLAPLAGRPLLAYTCDAALASKRLTRVVLSTDDEEIAAAGRACGVEVPFRRPAGLSGDETPMVEVLQDVAARLADRDGYGAEVLVVLQPTSPLRQAAHIDEAVELLLETGADSVVSVIEVPHQFSPVSLLRVADGRLAPMVEGPPILRRQDKPRVYARNGPAVIAVRREVVVERGSLYGDDCRPYLMALEDSVDIDTSFDLELAALLLARRRTA